MVSLPEAGEKVCYKVNDIEQQIIAGLAWAHTAPQNAAAQGQAGRRL